MFPIIFFRPFFRYSFWGYFPIFILVFGGTGCSVLQPETKSLSISGNEAILLKNADDLKQLPADAITIQSAQFVGEKLKLEVAYGGGCREHEFGLYVMPYLAESYPPQGSLVLTHNGNQDLCKAIVIKEIEFDFSKVKEFFPNEKMIIFALTSNGGKESYKERLTYKQ